MYKITSQSALSLIAAQIRYFFPEGTDNQNNSLFMLHSFCYCEREDCFWCSVVNEEFGGNNSANWADVHLSPNFWHKPSGLRVWWYKHVGRSMEVVVDNANANLAEIFLDVDFYIRRGRPKLPMYGEQMNEAYLNALEQKLQIQNIEFETGERAW